MYYPASAITPNQYTSGDEYVIKSTKDNYVGYYFTTFDGKAFTGKKVGDTTNEELIARSYYDQTSPDYTFVGNIFYSQILKGNDSSIQNLPTYSVPRASVASPTNEDYQISSFLRYFLKRTNNDAIMEISKEAFNDIEQGRKYNSALYETIEMRWQISGQLDTTISKGIITRGVKEINLETTNQTSLSFRGLNLYITDYTQFYKTQTQ